MDTMRLTSIWGSSEMHPQGAAAPAMTAVPPMRRLSMAAETAVLAPDNSMEISAPRPWDVVAMPSLRVSGV